MIISIFFHHQIKEISGKGGSNAEAPVKYSRQVPPLSKKKKRDRGTHGYNPTVLSHHQSTYP